MLTESRGAGGVLRRRLTVFFAAVGFEGWLDFLVAGFASHITRFFPHPPHPLPPWGRGRFFGLFRRGLPPPAPLRLNPRGAGAMAAYHAPVGGLPRRCRITLPSLSPMGGTAVLLAGYFCRPSARRERAAVLLAGFASRIKKFYPPSPRPPSPMGKGEFFGLFRRGLPPPAPLRLNPGGTGAGAAYHAPTGACPGVAG